MAFFRDSDPQNNYPNFLGGLYLKSATHAALVNSKTTYTVGKEFIYYLNGEQRDPDGTLIAWLDEVNSTQNIRAVYRDAAFNWAWSGNVWIKGVRAEGRISYKIISSEKVRISKDEKKAYISAHWPDIRNDKNQAKKPEFPVYTVPMYDGGETQGEFMLHIRRDAPGYDYYGLPDYISAIKDALIEHKVDQYNLDRLENGFFPSALITYFGETPEDQTPSDFIQGVVDTFTGEGNGGKIHATLVDTEEQAPEVTQFNEGKEGEFLDLESSAASGLVRAHRFFPALAGIETSGKLGSNQEIINQWHIVMGDVIGPDFQAPLNDLFKKLLMIAGYDGWTISQVNTPPVPLVLDGMPDGTVKKNEWREHAGLEMLDELGEELIGEETNEETALNIIAKLVLDKLQSNGE